MARLKHLSNAERQMDDAAKAFAARRATEDIFRYGPEPKTVLDATAERNIEYGEMAAVGRDGSVRVGEVQTQNERYQVSATMDRQRGDRSYGFVHSHTDSAAHSMDDILRSKAKNMPYYVMGPRSVGAPIFLYNPGTNEQFLVPR